MHLISGLNSAMADAGRSPLGLCWGGNHHAPCNIIRLGFVFFTFAKCYHKNIYCDLLPFLIASYVLKVQLSQYLFYPIRYSSFQLFLCYKMKQFSTATLSLNNKVLILDVSISIRYCHTKYQDAMLCRFLSPPLNLYPGPWDCEKLLEPLRAWQPLHTRGSWPGNDF